MPKLRSPVSPSTLREDPKGLPPDEVLRSLLENWARAEKRVAVVCFLDLDRFGELNQRMGIEGGDAALEEVVRRLKGELPGESLLARVGGDEFAAVFATSDSSQCDRVLERMLTVLAQPWAWRGHPARLNASLGAMLMDGIDTGPETALRQARHAAFFAKRAGDGKVHYFDAPQARADQQLVRERRRIHAGLVLGEFFLNYQPKVDMQRGLVVGVEALIRWQHSERGLLQPAQFIPVLEDDEQLVEQIGDWVIGTALRQADKWRRAGLRISVNVNVSPRHMMRSDFVDRLGQQLAQYPKLGPGALGLEILETTAISQFATAAQFVESCKALGVEVAIDDFGTGYSSLNYLRQLPVSSVKIDQSFIRGMLENAQDRAIVQGIIALLQALGRTAVAEGVESVQQGDALIAMGCTLGQGYGIARPMPAEDIAQWVAGFERAPLWGKGPAARRQALDVDHEPVVG